MTTQKTGRPHRQLQKRYCCGALTLAAVLGVCCVMAGWTTTGKGLALGAVFSVANFILMGEGMVLKFATHGGRSLLPLLVMVARYAMLALPVVVAIKQPAFDLPATVAGMFMVQICIIIDTLGTALRDRRRPPART